MSRNQRERYDKGAALFNRRAGSALRVRGPGRAVPVVAAPLAPVICGLNAYFFIVMSLMSWV